MTLIKPQYYRWMALGIVVVLGVLFLKKKGYMAKIIHFVKQLPAKGEYETRNLAKVDKIIIHHSASDIGKFNRFDFARWHIDPKGRLNAPRIAYHFVIEPDGQTYQTNELVSKSWHTKGANTTGIGIVLNGNFEHDQPTAAQIQALSTLILHLNKTLGRKLSVFGHKEMQGNSTVCPGKNLDLDRFKNLA